MKDRHQGRIQIGVSDLVGDFSRLPAMYMMAKTALMYFMYFQEQQIIFQ